jgi:HPt (histidine-containing phosphotransfer) domain-containing protein
MESLQILLQAMRSKFLTRVRAALGELTSIVSDYQSGSGDKRSVSRMQHHFHFLSGAGRTFGVPEISTLGQDGEAVSQKLIDEARCPTDRSLGKFKQLISELSKTLSADDLSASEPCAGDQNCREADQLELSTAMNFETDEK